MKYHDLDAPVSVLRRRLMLALPGGLAMATPLVVIGCGGSNSGEEPVAEPGAVALPPNPLIGLPPGDVTATAMIASIDMPVGVALKPAFVTSASGAVAVTSGQATVDVFADGPQLATVISTDGTPLLLGWVGVGRTTLSAESTAVVLLHFGLGLPMFGPATRDMLRERLEADVAVVTFAAQIRTILAGDPKALATGSAPLLDAYRVAVQALLPDAAGFGARAKPLGLKVEPATSASALQVVQGDALNSFFVDNIYARRAVVIVNREAWYDADGIRQAEPQAPVQVGEVKDLPLPTAFDSITNTVAGWADQYYTPDDANGFWRSVSDTVTLDIAPEAAKRTEYAVVVLMAGKLLPADADAFARLPAAQRAYVRGFDISKNVMWKTLLIDLAGPLLFSFLAEKLGEFAKGKAASEARQTLMKEFASVLFGVLQNQAPEVVEKLSDGSMDPWTAFKTLLKAMTFDPTTGIMSPLLRESLIKLAEFCVVKLAAISLRSPMLEVVTGLRVGGKGLIGVLPILKVINAFDSLLGNAALGRIAYDVARSRQMERWTITATKAKVVLRPDPFEVETTMPTYPIEAEIVDNDDDEYGIEKGSITFDWTCTGLYGSLYSQVDSGLQRPNTFTTSKNFAKPNYLPKGTQPDGAPETISVRAYFQPLDASQSRQLIGSKTITVKFKKAFSLRVTPPVTELPTDEQMAILASVVETLPKEASVRYEWRQRSGGGSLNISSADGDTQHSKVEYLAPADATVAVIEVVALVTVDPKLPPTRTEPVTSTITVKKGLKEVVMEVGGGGFRCGDCGSPYYYSGFVVPILKKAISYRAVFTGFGFGPCNRTVTWTVPKGDGGGCNFPITYHPFTLSSTKTDMWALWMGFGGDPLGWDTGGGKCVVTITVAP